MTVESYRIEPDDGTLKPEPLAFDADGNYMGMLVPDTRLQAITDAPKCEHDQIDIHPFMVQDAHGVSMRTGAWCEGAPKLRAAIKVLTEEDDSG